MKWREHIVWFEEVLLFVSPSKYFDHSAVGKQLFKLMRLDGGKVISTVYDRSQSLD